MHKKIAIKLFGILGLLATIGSGSAYACSPTPTTNPEPLCWFPQGNGPGFHLQYVVYDLRTANVRIQFGLKETPTQAYFYDLNTSDLAYLSRANAIYASLLSAKSTGDDVYIHIKSTGSPWWIDGIQVGAN